MMLGWRGSLRSRRTCQVFSTGAWKGTRNIASEVWNFRRLSQKLRKITRMILIESDSLSKRGWKKIMRLNFGPLQHTSCTQSGVRRMVILRKTRRTSKMPSACILQWLENGPKAVAAKRRWFSAVNSRKWKKGQRIRLCRMLTSPKIAFCKLFSWISGCVVASSRFVAEISYPFLLLLSFIAFLYKIQLHSCYVLHELKRRKANKRIWGLLFIWVARLFEQPHFVRDRTWFF